MDSHLGHNAFIGEVVPFYLREEGEEGFGSEEIGRRRGILDHNGSTLTSTTTVVVLSKGWIHLVSKKNIVSSTSIREFGSVHCCEDDDYLLIACHYVFLLMECLEMGDHTRCRLLRQFDVLNMKIYESSLIALRCWVSLISIVYMDCVFGRFKRVVRSIGQMFLLD